MWNENMNALVSRQPSYPVPAGGFEAGQESQRAGSEQCASNELSSARCASGQQVDAQEQPSPATSGAALPGQSVTAEPEFEQVAASSHSVLEDVSQESVVDRSFVGHSVNHRHI